MDYTKDNKLMELLINLSRQIDGYNYSLSRVSDERVISYRTKNVNDAIEEVKNHLEK